METPKQLGKGTYGCAYKPPICTSTFDTGDPAYLVGKIATPEGVKKEIEVAKILNECSKCRDYFGTLTGNSCYPRITPLLKKDCPIVDEEPDVVKSYSSKYVGITLSSYLKKNKVTMDWIYDQYTHLLQALIILQRYAIVHRDIKTDNILVDENGMCRIIDFGVAIIDPHLKNIEDNDLPFYTVWPSWYNAYYVDKPISPENRKKFYDTYEHLATYYDTRYAKGTTKDPIHKLLDNDSLEFDYGKKIIAPNIYKVDSYALADVFNDIYVARKDINRKDPKAICFADIINKSLQIFDVAAQFDAETALWKIQECYRQKANSKVSSSISSRDTFVAQLKNMKGGGFIITDIKWQTDDSLILTVKPE